VVKTGEGLAKLGRESGRSVRPLADVCKAAAVIL
jgi:hypothetical protein